MSSLVSLRRWQRPFALAVATTLVMTQFAPTVVAQPEDEAATLNEARAKFQQATEMEQAGNWAAALQLFREVGSVRMTPQVRYHIALCQEKLGRLVPALGGYEFALSEADTVGPGFRTEVEESIAQLRARIPKVVIQRGSGAEAATIELDGVALGASSIGVEVPIDPGPHAIRATAPGHEPYSETIEVEESSTETVVVELVPLPEEPTTRPSAPSKASSPAAPPKGFVLDRDFWMYASFAAGGVFLIGSGVSFLMQSQKADDVRSLCGGDWDCDGEAPSVFDKALDAESAHNTYRAMGFVSLGLGLAGAGAGTYLYFTRPKQQETAVMRRTWRVEGFAPGADVGGLSILASY